MASCDGTIHIWDSQTGKQISVFAESETESGHPTNHSASVPKITSDQANVLNLNTLSNGMLSSAFDSSLYTCMHLLDSAETLVVGTGNGSLRWINYVLFSCYFNQIHIRKYVDVFQLKGLFVLHRFIDVARGQKLHIWRGESNESSFHSLISAVCSSGSSKAQAGGISTSPSLIATGQSSGHCKLFDAKSGNVVASWRAHDGYVTKVCGSNFKIFTQFDFTHSFINVFVYSWHHLRNICLFPALWTELYESGTWECKCVCHYTCSYLITLYAI